MRIILIVFFLLSSPGHPLADANGSQPALCIRPGAIEAGLSGSLTAVEGISEAAIAVRGGRFTGAAPGLVGIEMEVGYSHVGSLDRLNLLSSISWQRALGKCSAYPFVAVVGGIRQEWLGSFRQARYPIGLGLGVRDLVGRRVGFRIEYRFLRILHDPVSDFSEHCLVVGLSVFFKNSRRPRLSGSPPRDQWHPESEFATRSPSSGSPD